MQFRLSLSALWVFLLFKSFGCGDENENGSSSLMKNKNSVRLDVNISEVTGLENAIVDTGSPSTLGLMVAIVNTDNETVCSQEITDASLEPSITCQIPLSQVVSGHNQFYVSLYDGQTGEVFGTMDASFYIDPASPTVTSFISPFLLSSSIHPIVKSNHRLLIGLTILTGTALGAHKLLVVSSSGKMTHSSKLQTKNNTSSDNKPPPPTPPNSSWSTLSQMQQLTVRRPIILNPLPTVQQTTTTPTALVRISPTPKSKRYGDNSTSTSNKNTPAARAGVLAAKSFLSAKRNSGNERSRVGSPVGVSLLIGAAAATVAALMQSKTATTTVAIPTSPATDRYHAGSRDAGNLEGSGSYRHGGSSSDGVYKLTANTSILRALTEHVWKVLTTLISRSGINVKTSF